MKNRIAKIVLTAATFLLATSLTFAAEVKTPDIKGAAKANAEKATAGAKADAKGATDKAKADVKNKIVDINSAAESELKAIPGIGDAYAAKIVAGRPYANKAQLKSRNILPAAVYEKVKDVIIAKQPKK